MVLWKKWLIAIWEAKSSLLQPQESTALGALWVCTLESFLPPRLSPILHPSITFLPTNKHHYLIRTICNSKKALRAIIIPRLLFRRIDGEDQKRSALPWINAFQRFRVYLARACAVFATMQMRASSPISLECDSTNRNRISHPYVPLHIHIYIYTRVRSRLKIFSNA